ncbi:aldose epimerase family protein [Cellulosilyticum sp. WCF-2]|uniref:aldose epimerase family protein n=1 Tax=Cellulosilyticum sp. WCF-2 TaxID=2497860 RepID=UPI000F8D9BAB|nr:aldose epimerase family protein [Cellulosilyticum sp. WCF-2]QEH67949.1 galactose mutarotase [Cellulosilyticum sp. WCF-2]
MKCDTSITISKKGNRIIKYLMTNDVGMKVEVLNLGATLTKVIVPDKEENFENVVLEWQDINVYEENPGYIGATIGRMAGRIHQGKITLDKKVYSLTKNENGNMLHGGPEGFHHKFWDAMVQCKDDEIRLQLCCKSKDGEEGFPGNVEVKVTYILNNDNELSIQYEAVTDQLTIVNLTNHAYFNLSGNGKRSILEQEVWIDSDSIFELDNESIPTGEFLSVDEEYSFDFRKAKPIGRDIHNDAVQLRYGKGYDHLWLLNQGEEKVVELYDPISERCMEITTTEPCVVMYTMNNPPNEKLEIAEQAIRYGVCFETQKCAIGYEEVFKEPCILRPDSIYQSETQYKFTVREKRK